MRYEDIVLNFDETLNRLLKFLNVPWHSQIQDYWLKNDEPKETSLWKLNTKRELQKKLVGRFKADLLLSEVEEFNSKAKMVLNQYNYES